jgi:DNA-binding transcriptional LysR family regulator
VDLEHLRTLAAVADHGSLTAAARSRHLTQPALSQHVKALEEELGVALLHRRSRGVTLTEAGRAALRQARVVLAAVDAVRAEAAEVRGLRRGTLRLGATDAAATGVLPSAFARFHRRHPGIDVAVEVHATGDLLVRLQEGRLEFGLCTLPVEAPDLVTEPLLTETLGLVAPRRAGGLAPGSLLAEHPFIAYPSGSITRRLVDAAFAAAGLVPRPVMEIGRPSVMLRLVAAGLGVSVLPVRLASGGGRVHRVPEARFGVKRRLGLVRLRDRNLEPAAREFCRVLMAGRRGPVAGPADAE